jgi:hypothetical protein
LFVNLIPTPPLIFLGGIIEYLFDIGEEFHNPTCTIGCWKIVTCHIPTTNYTSGDEKFLPIVKELFDKTFEEKKRRCRYDIYRKIDANYYGYRDDEENILEKLEWLMEEKMRDRALREWQRIESIKRESRLMVHSGDVVTIKPVLFKEEEYVSEEMGD